MSAHSSFCFKSEGERERERKRLFNSTNQWPKALTELSCKKNADLSANLILYHTLAYFTCYLTPPTSQKQISEIKVGNLNASEEELWISSSITVQIVRWSRERLDRPLTSITACHSIERRTGAKAATNDFFH